VAPADGTGAVKKNKTTFVRHNWLSKGIAKPAKAGTFFKGI